MAEPTDEQLREYAAKLPDLYREIFEAFYRLEPKRREHDPELASASSKMSSRSVTTPSPRSTTR